jgi:hypothetical protein
MDDTRLDPLAELTLRFRGVDVAQVTASVPALTNAVLTRLLRDAVRRLAGSDADADADAAIGEYEMDVRYLDAPTKALTFVSSN